MEFRNSIIFYNYAVQIKINIIFDHLFSVNLSFKMKLTWFQLIIFEDHLKKLFLSKILYNIKIKFV